MTLDEVILFVTGLNGVVAQTPREGDGTPELAWGDTFFYSPDGRFRPRSRSPRS